MRALAAASLATLALAVAPLVRAATPPNQPPGPTPPPAPLSPDEAAAAERLAVDSCQSCHSGTMLTQQRLTQQQWQASVKKMRGWGALLSDPEADLLARYLASRYGTDAPAAAPAQVDAAQAAAAIAPIPDRPAAGGDTAAGKRLYAGTCAACHGDDAHGASPSPSLVDKPILYRAPEFGEVVRDGRGRMPPQQVEDADLSALLAYLRTLR